MNAFCAVDLGNVIFHVNIEKFTSVLGDYFPEDLDPLFFINSLQAAQDVGLMTLRKALKLQYNIQNEKTIDSLIDVWNTTVYPNEMMLNFIENLKSEGIKIAILSNMGEEHAIYLRKICPELFKDAIEHFSYEVGARKPSKLYYQSFLIDHNEFTGSVYIDDKDENLQAGKKYTFKSFKFDLDNVLKLSQSNQKKELDKIKAYIFDRKY
jgi:FMN phosphatase YigB (HAD superfamily)